jgi:hypothetical protein
LHRNERGLIEPLFGRRGSQCSRGQRVFTERGSERHGPTRERSVPFRDDEDVSKEQGIRVSMDDYETIFMPEPTEEERKRLTCCLVRCSDGKRKISTKVFKNRAEKFSNDFTLVQRASMDGLKADPKKKKEKKKTKVMSSSVVGKDDVVDEQTTATKKKKKKKAKAKAKKEL